MADLGVAHLALRQSDGPPAGGQLRVRIARPQLVEHRRVGQRDGVAGAVRRRAPAVEHDQRRTTARAARPGRAASRHQRRPRRRSPRTTSASRLAPADQRAVDVGQREQLGGVVGLDAAAVEDRAVRCGLLARAVGDQRADERDRLLGLLGRRHPPGADRPDRLVRDHDLAELLGRRRLARSSWTWWRSLRSVSPRLALLLGLAHAQDRHQAGRERRRDLQRERPVGLAEQLAALGVAEDHAVDAELDQHRRRDLAGEGALGRRGACSARTPARASRASSRPSPAAPVNGGQIATSTPLGASRPAAAAPAMNSSASAIGLVHLPVARDQRRRGSRPVPSLMPAPPLRAAACPRSARAPRRRRSRGA